MASEKYLPYTFFIEVIKAIDTWRRLLVLCLLLLFSTAGVVSYFFRDSITLWFNNHTEKTSLKIDEMDSLAKKVINDTSAAKVTIWSVDLSDNYREVIYSRDSLASQEKEKGTAALLFTEKPGTAQFIVLLIEQNIFCLTPAQSEVLAINDLNAYSHYVCVVELPPGHGTILGFMVASYAEAPDQPELLRKRLLKVTREIMRGSVK